MSDGSEDAELLRAFVAEVALVVNPLDGALLECVPDRWRGERVAEWEERVCFVPMGAIEA